MKLVLLRHGQTDWNFEDRYQGRSDIPLNVDGQRQALEAAARWANVEFDAALVSPLQRAYDTASAVVGHRSIERHVMDDLMETAGGDWEGLTFPQIREQWPETFRDWRASNLDVGPVNGETPREAGHRVVTAVTEWISKQSSVRSLLVVGHGSALRAAAAQLAGFSDETYPELSRLENCHAHVLTQNGADFGRWELVEQNV